MRNGKWEREWETIYQFPTRAIRALAAPPVTTIHCLKVSGERERGLM